MPKPRKIQNKNNGMPSLLDILIQREYSQEWYKYEVTCSCVIFGALYDFITFYFSFRFKRLFVSFH